MLDITNQTNKLLLFTRVDYHFQSAFIDIMIVPILLGKQSLH